MLNQSQINSFDNLMVKGMNYYIEKYPVGGAIDLDGPDIVDITNEVDEVSDAIGREDSFESDLYDQYRSAYQHIQETHVDYDEIQKIEVCVDLTDEEKKDLNAGHGWLYPEGLPWYVWERNMTKEQEENLYDPRVIMAPIQTLCNQFETYVFISQIGKYYGVGLCRYGRVHLPLQLLHRFDYIEQNMSILMCIHYSSASIGNKQPFRASYIVNTSGYSGEGIDKEDENWIYMDLIKATNERNNVSDSNM
jgi:hypothetical protein